MNRNDGYALPFVLVVMVVVCLIAVSVMSFSLRCLQSQQASIESMAAKYEALGEIEKTIAQIENAPFKLTEFENVDCRYAQKDGKHYFVIRAGETGADVGYVLLLTGAPNDRDFTGIGIEAYLPLDALEEVDE